MLNNALKHDWDLEAIILTNHDAASDTLIWAQQLAFLELLLSAADVIPSSFMVVALQLIARNVPLLLVVVPRPVLHTAPPLLLIYIAWTATEVVRFPWLLLKSLLGGAPQWLTWIRYSCFILLYPLGAIGEGWTMWLARDEGGVLDLPLGIRLKVRPFISYIYMPCFLGGFLTLYSHMFRQRARKLGLKRRSSSSRRKKSA
jgi:very-long-chain (3R)-3-hydroxyacyl-CoA dehydratase